MSTTAGDSAILRGIVLIMRKMGIPKDEIIKTLEYQGEYQAIKLFNGGHVDNWENSSGGATGIKQDLGNPAAGAGGMGGGHRRRAKTRCSKAKRSRRASKHRK